jgi:peptidoglycan/xylan/chitin deacetylase (PgdA/CDA1 family)/cell wall-associated NlpC family hydrolase
MKRFLALVASAIVLSACGASPAARPSPSSSPWPSTSPSQSSTPTPSEVSAGVVAYASVNVATGWRSPQSPRAVDAPALENPAHIEDWIAGMTAADQLGLVDRVDTQLLLGDAVEVLKVEGDWARVVVPNQATPLDSRGYPVWIPVRQLTTVAPPDSAQSVIVLRPTTLLRQLRGGNALRVSFGTELPVLSEDSGAYTVAINGAAALLDKSAAAVQTLPATGASIVATASSFLGLTYLWGGTSGFGYDCSGFVYSVFKAHGILLPRDADPQSRMGQAVSRADLQPGDLIFFASGGIAYHVVIYAGQGLVIDSPSPGYPVEEVPLASLTVIGDYSDARRVLSPATPSPIPAPAGPPRSLAGAEWTRLPTNDRVVALTFDAGGNDAGVAPILRALADARAPATFFLTGRWTEVYPDDARTIANSYAIGNHTYDHPYLTSLNDAQVADELLRAERTIEANTHRDPHPLFRFPYGSSDARTLADVHALGYGGIRWTVDTLGWEGKSNGQSTASVIRRVLNSLQPGEIVLMHVGAANDGTTLDADALPTLINELRARGYTLALVNSYV